MESVEGFDFNLYIFRTLKHQKELEQFRRKDPPVLTMDEMEDSAELADAIQKKILKDKEIALVRTFSFSS